jgi:hypothetical protein
MALVDTTVEQSFVPSVGGSLIVHVPFCSSTEGARQSLCLVRHQGGSSSVESVEILLLVERIMCAVVAAPTATPASVRIDSRCPAPPVDYQTG